MIIPRKVNQGDFIKSDWRIRRATGQIKPGEPKVLMGEIVTCRPFEGAKDYPGFAATDSDEGGQYGVVWADALIEISRIRERIWRSNAKKTHAADLDAEIARFAALGEKEKDAELKAAIKAASADFKAMADSGMVIQDSGWPLEAPASGSASGAGGSST